LLQAECADIRARVAEQESAEDAVARKAGFNTLKEAQALKAAVVALR
jgi:hypothetical protein